MNPSVELTQLGPHTSEWIIEKGKLTRLLTLLVNKLWLCFPCWHNSQSKVGRLDKRGTIFKLDRDGCLNWQYTYKGEVAVVPAMDSIDWDG